MHFFNPPPGVFVIESNFLQVWVVPYGARLMQLWWMTAPEGPRPLTLGFQDPAHYRQDGASMGAVCGRYANRIGEGKLSRNGKHWDLDINNAKGHCLHGGREGSGQLDWTVQAHGSQSVTLMLTTENGHMGFPGACTAQVTYAVEGARLHWQVHAQVSAPCPLNFAQHSYWNLDGQSNLDQHRLQVDAQAYLPTDARDLPLPLRSVQGTCFDFRSAAKIRFQDVPSLDVALQLDDTSIARRVAKLSVPDLSMAISTDKPWMHVYASAHLKPSHAPLGVAHQPGNALCLEAEDIPNGPALGAAVWYAPGETYTHNMAYDFLPDGGG
jgi:aldose 1-epimerase